RLAALDVPEAERAVLAAGGEDLSVGGEGHREDEAGVAREGAAGRGGEGAEREGRAAGEGQGLPGAGEGDGGDRAGALPGEGAARAGGGGRPEADRAVEAGGGEELAVGREDDRDDLALMPAQDPRQPAGERVGGQKARRYHPGEGGREVCEQRE